MGKDKLIRWEENKTFEHVFEPSLHEIAKGATFQQGKWRENVFHNDNPIVLELGCGKGEYTVGLAKLFPEKNFIGVDIKGHRFWRGAKSSKEEGLKNVAFLRARIEMIERFFGPNEVDEIWLTFSDPQLKDRREKKRLSGPGFVKKYRQFCKPGSILHLKTDNTFLYEWTLEQNEEFGVEVLNHTSDVYGDYFEQLDELDRKVMGIRTYYEMKFVEQGEKIKYIKSRL
ncbi:MAG: tRNA (guanosine(46)-N7)-methyltransferase TrmB [Flavobacteriales bacterium]|nr:tRNA (guanosine(46)-N7)-methyltransferase TrmB [Flavobacteriales bacterium]